MSASIEKKGGQNRTKYCYKQNKTNKQNKWSFFLPKINRVFLSPILQILFWKWSSRRARKDATKQKVKNAKWWSKSNLPLSYSLDCKMFPFKKGFKKYRERKINRVDFLSHAGFLEWNTLEADCVISVCALVCQVHVMQSLAVLPDLQHNWPIPNLFIFSK